MNPIMPGIYSIHNVVNGRTYVGSAVSIYDRWGTHRRRLLKNKHNNRLLQNSWNKHGEDRFSFTVLEVVADKSDLIMREQWWIDEIDAGNARTGFNLSPTAGNTLGVKYSREAKAKLSAMRIGNIRSAETRAKMSAALKGRTLSVEHRAKIGAAKTGKTRRPFSAEHRAKLSTAQKGKTLSAETRAKVGAANKVRLISAETRAKLIAANKNRPAPSYETRARISAKLKGRSKGAVAW